MKISVVIPCFGGQDRLDKSLATLLNQTVQTHEIIVVDDGSEIPITVPSGVRLLCLDRQPTYRGSSAAKNFGAQHATGDWLAFSDNDILHMPDAIESVKRCIKALGRSDALINVLSMGLSQTALDDIRWTPTADRMEALFKTVAWHGVDKRVAAGEVLFSEQHFGLIKHSFFDSLGGYDSRTFKSWGYNNQDLTIRVKRAGGLATSKVFRRDGTLLRCFHMHNPEARDSVTAHREFQSKYGTPFRASILTEEAHAV